MGMRRSELRSTQMKDIAVGLCEWVTKIPFRQLCFHRLVTAVLSCGERELPSCLPQLDTAAYTHYIPSAYVVT